MPDAVCVSEVRFTPAPERLLPTGLIGWASFSLDSRFKVAGVSVRRTRSGRRVLSYPVRDDGVGLRWELLKPLDDETRRAVEEQVLAMIPEVSR